jgi:hypothetical protein
VAVYVGPRLHSWRGLTPRSDIGETRGRTLEEINIMFARKVPARKWAAYVVEGDDDTAKVRPDAKLEDGTEKHETAPESRIEKV